MRKKGRPSVMESGLRWRAKNSRAHRMTLSFHAWNKFHATDSAWISIGTRTASSGASSGAAMRSRAGFGSAPRQVTTDQTLSPGPGRAAIKPKGNDRRWAGSAALPVPPYPSHPSDFDAPEPWFPLCVRPALW